MIHLTFVNFTGTTENSDYTPNYVSTHITVFVYKAHVTKYTTCYPSPARVSHPGYMSKKLPRSKPATVTLVETTQGHISASFMTGQYVFKPKPTRQITTTLPTKTGACAPCGSTLSEIHATRELLKDSSPCL